jgi:hypothetical protein
VPDGISAWFVTANRFQTSGGAAREIEMDENNERVVFVYTTHPSVVEAERIGRELLQRRLCACVNILPGMVSLYWWQGAIERGEEAVMIIPRRACGSGSRRGAADALLYDAGNIGLADRASRRGLQFLALGGDGQGANRSGGAE